jgi:hypothetical protein
MIFGYLTFPLSETCISVAHIYEFYNLSAKIQEVQLTEDPDIITWKLTSSATYSSTLAYLAQFIEPPTSFMKPAVWANWAPPKCKTFAWWILQKLVWSSDLLICRG